ncbi:protein of unknown function [Modestobacter italicus]|uniref:Uncharacterized protein n=1 Tax=Modestobacter italicus (strain DSM 44449 / CECT 9708 / BC 501) TaxID=2732864 RepID=I4F0K5_MODI5|nr:protein of unknown function [Modestobacter marinus]
MPDRRSARTVTASDGERPLSFGPRMRSLADATWLWVERPDKVFLSKVRRVASAWMHRCGGNARYRRHRTTNCPPGIGPCSRSLT